MSIIKGLRSPQRFKSYVSGYQLIWRKYCQQKALNASNIKFKPTIKLSDGREIPQIGLGTWNSLPGVVELAVVHAICAGYRHIDCAHVYLNEKQVGAAIKSKIQDKTVKREELWVTSKLWNTFHHPSAVEKACKISLENLRLDYLDLYLMHWPMGYKEDWENLIPVDKNKKIIYSDVDFVDTWQAMECLVHQGLCKSIGVANFCSCQLERILEVATVPLVMNQIECHPYLNRQQLREFCKSKNIAVTAYSPLGSPGTLRKGSNDPVLLEDGVVKKLAEKYKKVPGQILIRFQIQLGNVVIPKSVNKERMACNLDVFNFELSGEDMKELMGLQRDHRFVTLKKVIDHPFYPFKKKD